jgi:putative transposase
MGQATPHRVKRHAHPDVKPHAPAPIEATGIDYLRLIEAAHQANIGQAINYAALAEGDPTRDDHADGDHDTD